MTEADEQTQQYSERTEELFEELGEEQARQVGRELLELTDDGLKLDHRQGHVVIGDTVVQIAMYPDGITGERITKFRYEFLEDHAENWWLSDDDPVLEMSWWKRGVVRDD